MRTPFLILLVFLIHSKSQFIRRDQESDDSITLFNIDPLIISEKDQVFLHLYFTDDGVTVPYWNKIKNNFEQLAKFYEMPMEKDGQIYDFAKDFLEVEDIPCVVYFPQGKKQDAEYLIFDKSDSFADIIKEFEEKSVDYSYHLIQSTYNQFLFESLELNKLSIMYLPAPEKQTEDSTEFFFQNLIAVSQKQYPNEIRYVTLTNVKSKFLEKFKIKQLPAMIALHDKYKFTVLQELTTKKMREFMFQVQKK